MHRAYSYLVGRGVLTRNARQRAAAAAAAATATPAMAAAAGVPPPHDPPLPPPQPPLNPPRQQAEVEEPVAGPSQEREEPIPGPSHERQPESPRSSSDEGEVDSGRENASDLAPSEDDSDDDIPDSLSKNIFVVF